MNLSCVQPLSKLPNYLATVTFPGSSSFLHNHQANPSKSSRDFRSYKDGQVVKRKGGIVRGGYCQWIHRHLTLTQKALLHSFFAVSLFPYIGFLYFITKSNLLRSLLFLASNFLLAFLGATSEFSGISVFLSQIFLLY